MSCGTPGPQVLVTVLDEDTFSHGAHVFRRVGNSNRVVDAQAPRWVRGAYVCKVCGGQLEDWEAYCPWCGRRLRGTEGGA